MEAFCPRCGRETSGLGPRGLCPDCYLEEHDLLEVPDRIAATLCKHCGAVKPGPAWEDAADDRERIYHVLDHHLDGEDVVAVSFTEDEDSEAYDVTIMVEQAVDGVVLQDEVETRIELEVDQCEICAKFHGGYYRYQLQIRGDVPEDVLEPLMDRAAAITDRNREHFLSDVQEVDDGYDLFISTRHMAEELVKVLEDRYTVEKQRSKELIGEEEGERVYRTVISARIVSDTASPDS